MVAEMSGENYAPVRLAATLQRADGDVVDERGNACDNHADEENDTQQAPAVKLHGFIVR